MSTFHDAAADYLANLASDDVRRRCWSRFVALGLPSTTDEVWRYAPLSSFSLDRYAPTSVPRAAQTSALAEGLASRAALVVRLVDGFLEESGDLEGVSVSVSDAPQTLSTQERDERYATDSFALLNGALSPATVVLQVDPGRQLEGPIVILNRVNSSAAFPRVHVVVGRSGRASVVECLEGGADALVAPIWEYRLDADAELRMVSYQSLEPSAWHVARTSAILARDARLRQAVVGVGAGYDRSRNDAELLEPGASNELRTTYLGSGDQVHDFRTHQLHLGAHTQSTLLAKGAVADRSRSIYTGLIEIEKGAKRTDARQTNRNLLLSPEAHADSVPNLEIRENDVVCAHASSVGPLDEIERWYLESRGVERREAERLMIRGFYNEMMVALPQDIAPLVEADIAEALSHVEVVTP